MDIAEYAKQSRGHLSRLFDKIPKGKFASVMDAAEGVEVALGRGLQAMRLLVGLRKYFLDTTGEESPFVKEIDKIVPRGE
jgi:hypothetical protein